MICACIGISLITVICYSIYRYLFIADVLKEYNYPYHKPGIIFKLKSVYHLTKEFFFWKKNKRFNFHDFYSPDPEKCGTKPSKMQKEMEFPQKLSNSNVLDEVDFMGVNLTSDTFLQIKLARRNKEQSEAIIHFVVDHDGDRKEFTLPLVPKTLTKSKNEDDQSWGSKDLKIWCLKPLSRWRIAFNGFLKDKKTEKVSHVTFSFVWTPFSLVIDHQTDMSLELRSKIIAASSGNSTTEDLKSALNQYDQWGTFYGFYSIDNSGDNDLTLFGSKIRNLGTCDFEKIQKYFEVKCYTDDGSVVYFKAICLPSTFPQLLNGYVHLWNGKQHMIRKTNLEFIRIDTFQKCPSLLSITFEAGDDTYTLDIKSEKESVDYYWGPNEEFKVNSHKASMKLTMLQKNITLDCSGTILVKTRNSKEFNGIDDGTPILYEPDIDLTSSTPDILPFKHNDCQSSNIVGGKGSSLAMLMKIDGEFKVPNGFCVTIAANKKYLNQNLKIKQSLDTLSNICCGKLNGNIEKQCSSLNDFFLETPLSDELKNEIKSQLEKSFENSFDKIRFAIRSSAAGEDGEEMSAAGQMETILGCKGLNSIYEGIQKCWASCYGFRAVQYRRQNGQPIEVGMGVVVQEMVNADKAGVLFTRDPVTANPGIISIAANYGIGESVVSAMSEPDNIVINRTYDDKLSVGKIDIGNKEIQVHMSDKDGMIETKDANNDKICCLTNQEALDLAQLSIQIEQSYGNPRDIEWAIYENKIYLLQARPITNLFPETENYLKHELNMAASTDKEWGTSGNFKEVFPGASSPLSLAVLNSAFINSSIRLGFLFGRSEIPNNLFVRGHVVYQQHRFNNRGDTLYSGSEKNVPVSQIKFRNGIDIAFNGRLMDDGDLKSRMLQRTGYISLYYSWKRTLNSVLMIISAKRTLKKMAKNYTKNQFKIENCKTSDELAEKFVQDSYAITEAFFNHVVITFGSMMMNASVLVRLLGDSDTFNDEHYSDFALLMSIHDSSDDIESADVPAALKKLAEEIVTKYDEEIFVKFSKEEAVKFMSNEDSPLKASFENFIEKHGHRCIKEFDIFSSTWGMEPEKIVTPLQALIKSRHLKKEKKLNIDEAIAKLQTPLKNSAKKSLKTEVLRARLYVGYREQAKSWLIRTIDQYRQAFRNLAKMMVSEGRIPDEDILFFTTVEEVMQLVKTRSASVIQRAMKRKRLHAKLDKLKFPEVNIGIPKPIVAETRNSTAEKSKLLRGTPVSLGVIEGVARVVTDIENADEIQPGDILVTHATDIAWSPYFPSLSGVITEIGGLISHGAVVAREYGIPCVVSVKDATFHLKSGDMIRLNGDDGTIVKLE